jgi:hypothetical protein
LREKGSAFGLFPIISVRSVCSVVQNQAADGFGLFPYATPSA